MPLMTPEEKEIACQQFRDHVEGMQTLATAFYENNITASVEMQNSGSTFYLPFGKHDYPSQITLVSLVGCDEY